MSSAQLAAFHQTEAHAVQLPYLILGIFVLAWAALTALTPFPRVAVVREPKVPGQSLAANLGSLFSRPRYLFGVVAQFFYVGAQVGVWSYLIRYAQRETGAGERTAADYLFISLVAFTAASITPVCSGEAGGAQHLCRVEREVEALAGIEPRIAHCLVAIVEHAVQDPVGAAGALGDVVAGQLDMNAARMRSGRPVSLEEAFDLIDDIVEPSSLVAVGRREPIAVHRVGDPERSGVG